VISERAEKASVIITTSLPFSEWTKVFTNARLCKALLDRLTDRAHIIETGHESFRFRRTLARQQAGLASAEASRDASEAESNRAAPSRGSLQSAGVLPPAGGAS
jgi:hypothetical protein